MIQRRAKAARHPAHIGNHSFRATGLTALFENGGRLELAQLVANHESSWTTSLYMLTLLVAGILFWSR